MGSLAADHLIVPVKFNVFRGLISNSMILGFLIEEGMHDEALSLFSQLSELKIDHLALALPTTLRPTKLQREISHHPWIDLLPIRRMRDNLLRAGRHV
jgi:hypothetical protein